MADEPISHSPDVFVEPTENERLMARVRSEEMEKLRKNPPKQEVMGSTRKSDLIYACFQLEDVKGQLRKNEDNVRAAETQLRLAREQLARVQAHQEYWRDQVKRHS